MKEPRLSLVLPLYNEEEHLTKSLPRIFFYLERLKLTYEVIFVEDKSRDQTLDMISVFVKNKKNIFLIKHQKNQGRGQSVKDGVLKARGEIVGFIDVDLEVSPLFIQEVIEPLLKKEADLTIGLRIYHVSLATFLRFILSKGYIQLVKSILGLPFSDTEAGFKFFNRKKILPIIKKTKNKNWFFDTEIVARAYQSGLLVKEIPVLFVRNTQKTSTVSPLKDSLVYLWELVKFKRKLYI